MSAPLPTAEDHRALLDALRSIAAALDALAPAVKTVESYPAGGEAHAVLRGLATANLGIKSALEVESKNTSEFRRKVEELRLQQRAERLEKELVSAESLAARSRGAVKTAHAAAAERIRAEWQAALHALAEFRGS